MNRFKLLLLLLLAIAFGVLWLQNRQPLSLKLLCPDTATSCWYRTPSLPLALWIALFVLGGVLSSLIWQSLNSFAYASRRKSGYTPAEFPEEPSTGEGNFTTPSTFASSTEAENTATTSSSYEVEREPETIRRSGSTYSYKFKDKAKRDRTDESVAGEPDNQKHEDDEDWI
ncbi:hypothetical protein [Myxosarcina sp. GI1(2024)]